MVKRAAKFLICIGPATGQERWEENGGYSPSTLAVDISALVCAAQMLQRMRRRARERFLLDYADFLESHLEPWTVTTQGTLVPGISRHFIRILPVDVTDPHAPEDPNNATIPIKNRPAGRAIRISRQRGRGRRLSRTGALWHPRSRATR